MTDNQITALVREYAKEVHNFDYFFENENKRFLTWLTRRFCLVKKDKLQELEIARRAKEHGAVWLNQWEAGFLFPDLGKEME